MIHDIIITRKHDASFYGDRGQYRLSVLSNVALIGGNSTGPGSSCHSVNWNGSVFLMRLYVDFGLPSDADESPFSTSACVALPYVSSEAPFHPTCTGAAYPRRPARFSSAPIWALRPSAPAAPGRGCALTACLSATAFVHPFPGPNRGSSGDRPSSRRALPRDWCSGQGAGFPLWRWHRRRLPQIAQRVSSIQAWIVAIAFPPYQLQLSMWRQGPWLSTRGRLITVAPRKGRRNGRGRRPKEF